MNGFSYWISTFIIFFNIGKSYSQPARDFLLTAPIYCDTFSVIDSNIEDTIAQRLMGQDLNKWLEDTLINTDNMRGFALPLGVFKRTDTVNFTRGMLNMWQAKARYIKNRSIMAQTVMLLTALTACEANLQAENKMTLREYRKEIIMPAIDTLHRLHSEFRGKYSAEREEFMSLITDNITANVLLAYNIQELLPPTHMLDNGEIKDINPLYKACFLDRLLREAGTEFIRYFPAYYDQILSYGPFQLTPIAFADIQANNRLGNNFKKYHSFDDLNSTDDHALAAAIFAYNNWERLSFLLQADGTIQKFNNWFRNYADDAEKKRKLQLFTAGMTACLHHHPPNTNRMIRSYFEEAEGFDKLHYEITEKHGSRQLKKYYRSTAEAFLILKVYHLLIEKYDEQKK